MKGIICYTHPAVHSVLHLENNRTNNPFTTLKTFSFNKLHLSYYTSLIYKKIKRPITMKHCIHIQKYTFLCFGSADSSIFFFRFTLKKTSIDRSAM